MRIEISAGGISGGVAVSQFQSNINGYLRKTDDIISSFATVRKKTYNLNGGVGNLQSAADHIAARVSLEQDRKSGAETVRAKANDFLNLAARVDKNVASLVNQNKEQFYRTNPWLRPTPSQEAKNFFQNAWDWLCGAGENIKNGVQNAWNWTREKAKELWDWVTDGVKDGVSHIKQWAAEKLEWAKDSLERAFNSLVDFYQNSGFAEKVQSFINNTVSTIQSAGDYLWKSLKKFVLGDYDTEDNITLLSFAANIVTGIFDVDLPLDIRDLVYDIQHWGEDDHFAFYFVLDLVALIPVIGAVKYLKHADDVADSVKQIGKAVDSIADAADELHDTVRNIDDAADIADTIHDTTKTADNVSDAADAAHDTAKTTDTISDGAEEAKNAQKGAEDVANATDNAHDAEKTADVSKEQKVLKNFDKPVVLTDDSVRHLRQEKIKGKSISGGHNLTSFENTITKNGGKVEESVIKKVRHPTIDGIYDITYRVPDGHGGYKEIYKTPKTVYDPSKISDSQIVQWANEAFNGTERKVRDGVIQGRASNGLLFEGFIDEETGAVSVFYPKFDPYQ